MEKFKLSKPIMINDKEYKELTYDFESMTTKDLMEVNKTLKSQGLIVAIAEFDMDYHLHLFAQAVCCGNQELAITDVLRMSAKDAVRAAGLARSFFFLDSEELSQVISSDESSPTLQ